MFSVIEKSYKSPKSKGSKKHISSTSQTTSAVDPVTGKPYSFMNDGQKISSGKAVISMPGKENLPWVMQGTSFAQGDYDRDSGQAQDQFGAFDKPDYDPNWTRTLGYNGSPEGFPEWAKANGYQLALGQMKGGGKGGQDLLRLQIFKNGQPIGDEHRWTKDEKDPGFGIGMAVMAAFMGNMAAASAAAGGGSSISAVQPGEYGELGYGSGGQGVTGFSTASANGQLLDPSAYEGLTSGVSPTPTGAVDAAFGGVSPVEAGEFGELGYGTAGTSTGATGAGGAAGVGGGASGFASPGNAATIESSLGTPGYGASSSGVGNAVGSIPGGSWYDMLQAGDIAGAVKAGGSGVLDFLTSPKGLNLLGGIANGLIGNNAANDALKAQKDAAEKALALQKYMYDTTRGDQATYRQTGEVGAARMRNLLADPSGIQKDPSYAWGLTQGQKSIDQSAASRGGLYSGATLKALQRYGQDYGNTKLNDAYTRYGDAARLGEAATANVGAAGSNYANNASKIGVNQGDNSAEASLYGANIWQQGINNSLAQLNRSTYQPVKLPGD